MRTLVIAFQSSIGEGSFKPKPFYDLNISNPSQYVLEKIEPLYSKITSVTTTNKHMTISGDSNKSILEIASVLGASPTSSILAHWSIENEEEE